MKKIYPFAAALVAILALGVLTETITFARVTSSAIDRDVWCVGVSGAEVCVDSSGNFIPTTTNVSDLGTSSLKFKDLYIDGTAYIDTISGTDASFSGTSSFTGTSAFTGAVTAVGANGISVSTSATSGTSMRLRGAVVTLSTFNITTGDIWYQTSDNVLYVATRTVTLGDAACVATGCYSALN